MALRTALWYCYQRYWCRPPTPPQSRRGRTGAQARQAIESPEKRERCSLLEFPGPFGPDRPALPLAHRGIPIGRSHWRMRRYELMLVLRPDLADDKVQASLERTARAIAGGGGQIVKQAPWGRRRLAYPIDHHREGSYYVILFEAPATAIAELERGLMISEEVLRHLVTRVERPVRATRGHDADADLDVVAPPSDDDELALEVELIDESETEEAPAAID